MFKKFVSKTLLSMVMDKSAREKFEAVQEVKRAQKKNKPDDAQRPSAVMATDAARKTAASIPAAPVPPPPDHEADDTASLVREALESAERELVAKKTRPPMTGDRQALIKEAMSIRRSQSKVLDELDPKQREKLMFMALKSLGGDAES